MFMSDPFSKNSFILKNEKIKVYNKVKVRQA